MFYKAIVIDRHANRVVGKYTTIKDARRAVDKKDNEYGGYKHIAYELNTEVCCTFCQSPTVIKFIDKCIPCYLAKK